METKNLSELAHFLPRQLEATKAADTHTYTLYGGSAGPGKSYWLRWYPIRKMMQWGQIYGLKGIHGAIFSKDYGTLKDRQVSKMEVEFPRWLGDVKTTNTDGLGFHLRPQYGGHVLLLRNLDDPSKYLSSEFAIIAQEEVTENDEDTFHKLRGRLRWTGIPDPKWIGATNPGGKGHSFCKKLWIDRDFPEELKLLADQFVYVRALPADNPYLAKSYLSTLDSLPEKLRKAYRDGDWNVFEGQYFSEWRDDIHVIKPFHIPYNWRRFGALDFGRTNPFAFLWFALDYDGNVYCYREYYETGKEAEENGLNVMRRNNNEKLEYVVGDSSIFSKVGFSETIADILMRAGIGGSDEMPILLPSAKDRVSGWVFMHEYLRHAKLKFFSTCVNSIKTIPSLVYDERNVEDLDSGGDDHCLVRGTKISTIDGNKFIENVVIGDLVVTRNGYRRVIKSALTNRRSKVYKVTFTNGSTLIGTFNHPIFVRGKGFVFIDALRYNDRICARLSYPQQFKNLMEKSIIGVVSIFNQMVRDFILLFGNITMKRSDKAFTYTTGITIGTIMILRTYSALELLNIYPIMGKNIFPTYNTWKRSGLSLRNGMVQKKVENGIVYTVKRVGKIGKFTTKNVLFVTDRIKHTCQKYLNSVILTVKQHNLDSDVRVQKVEYQGIEPVWNLTIENQHEYFANGILTHNSADATRYFLQTLRERKTMPLMSNVERKLAEMKKTQLNFNERYSI